MSTAKTIVDTIKTQLGTITGVGLVTEDIKIWNGAAEQYYNRLFLRPVVQAGDWMTFPSVTAMDREYEMRLLVEGVISTLYPADIEGELDTLQNEIEIKLLGDTSITAVIDDATLVRYEKDTGFDEAYGLFELEFLIDYTANHNSP